MNNSLQVEYNSFNEYLEAEYETTSQDEFYECNGGHLWHIGDILKEWENS